MTASLARFVLKRPETSAVIVTVALTSLLTITTGGTWLSFAILQSVLRVTAVLAIMAFGEALVISAGEIDISVGSIFAVGAMVFIGVGRTLPTGVALPLALGAGVLIGLGNGAIVARFRAPSLIVTLGTLLLFRGIAYGVTEGFNFAASDEVRALWLFNAVGGARVAGLNIAVLWALLALAVLHLMVFYTPLGNHVLAVGGNAVSSYSRGVNVARVRLTVFALSGLLAAFAGVLDAANIGYVDGSFGELMELEAIAAAVLGGCSLAGGRCSLLGTLFGAFLLRAVQSYLVILGIQPQWFILLLGAIVVLAGLSDVILTKVLVRLAAVAKMPPAAVSP